MRRPIRAISLRFFLVALTVSIATLACASSSAFAASLCCPADLSGDSAVDGSDLAIVLGAWGNSGVADLDGSGLVGPEDLGILLGAWGPCPVSCPKTLVVGSVTLKGGLAAEGALVFTSIGGRGVSVAGGVFEFEVSVLDGVRSFDVTALVEIKGASYAGTVTVDEISLGGVTDAGTIVVQATDECSPTWLPGFGQTPGVYPDLVEALAVFDDGSGNGPALYVGGGFTSAGGVASPSLARWDGSSWSGVIASIDGSVNALTVVPAGAGLPPGLYVGGTFTSINGQPLNRVARWDGTNWWALGSGVNAHVTSFALLDELSGGPRLRSAGTSPRLAANPPRESRDGTEKHGRASATVWTPRC